LHVSTLTPKQQIAVLAQANTAFSMSSKCTRKPNKSPTRPRMQAGPAPHPATDTDTPPAAAVGQVRPRAASENSGTSFDAANPYSVLCSEYKNPCLASCEAVSVGAKHGKRDRVRRSEALLLRSRHPAQAARNMNLVFSLEASFSDSPAFPRRRPALAGSV
jgi:hypothetical protein